MEIRILVYIFVLITILCYVVNILNKINKKYYRLGNYIDLWYDNTNIFTHCMNRLHTLDMKIEGFKAYLSTHQPIQYKSPQRFRTSLKMWKRGIANINTHHLYFWCYDYTQYQRLYPHFNVSLRHAVSNYFGNKQVVDKSTCVVHYRVGDALCHGEGIWPINKVFDCVKECFHKYRHLKNIIIMDGGKHHQQNCSKNQENRLNVFRIKLKQLGIPIIPNQGTNADEDFLQMIQSSVLITGVGSFASMAAAANPNIRYTPNLFNILGERVDIPGNVNHVYENWYTYG